MGRPAQAQLLLRLRARKKEGKEKGPPKGILWDSVARLLKFNKKRHVILEGGN